MSKKKLLVILFLSFSQSNGWSGEQIFRSPNPSELVETSFEILDLSLESVSIKTSKDCDDKQQPATVAESSNEIFCLCEYADKDASGLKVTKKPSILGEIQSTEIRFDSGNDNFLHGILQLNPDLRKFDGDDRGRTFGINANYKITGDNGEFLLNAGSVGFGKFSPQGGYRKDSSGKYYLNFREVNMLETQFNKNMSSTKYEDESSKTYVLGSFKFEQSTDSGYLSRNIQNGWHKMNQSVIKDAIQYNYVKDLEDINTIKVMGGIGSEWIKNLGNWKCATRAEVKAGMSYGYSQSEKVMTPEVSGYSSIQLSNNHIPWVALSAWLQAGAGYQGNTREGGVEVSFPIKTKNYIIKPFIGIERHKTNLDRQFGTPAGNPYENYHVVGVSIKY